MALPRADRLKEPPVVGRWYMVPTVLFSGWGLLSDWPVIGKRHEDSDHLDYPHQHYHADVRFLTRVQTRAMTRNDLDDLFTIAARTPLAHSYSEPPAAATTLKRVRCRYADHAYPIKRTLGSPQFRNLYNAYAGHECKFGKAGWICPHRNFPLGSIAAIDGVITCPLHGLRIDAVTGVCLRSNGMPHTATTEPIHARPAGGNTDYLAHHPRDG